MLRVVIVEDEWHSREMLHHLVQEYCAAVQVVASAASVEEGVAVIRKTRPDLVFLDIEMQTGNGFELLEKTYSLHFDVIFTTAFEHYALKAIKFSAIDYLLKPIDVEELIEAVEKVHRKRKNEWHSQQLAVLVHNLQTKNHEQHTITLSTTEGLEFIKVTDIIRCEAMGSYTHFFLKNGRKILVSKHLKEYENLLTDYHFFRIHQSHLINLAEVERFSRKNGGHVILKDKTLLKISSHRRELFINLMQQ